MHIWFRPVQDWTPEDWERSRREDRVFKSLGYGAIFSLMPTNVFDGTKGILVGIFLGAIAATLNYYLVPDEAGDM